MRYILFICLSYLFTPQLWAQFEKASIENLKTHVYTLASDSLQGRGSGSPGQKLAAEYIANHFNKLGLENKNNSYYVPFNLYKSHKDKAVIHQEKNMLFSPWHFFYAANYNHNDTLSDSLLFVGYGSKNEINTLNLNNKSILMLANNPKQAYKTIQTIKQEYNNLLFIVLFKDENKEVELAWKYAYELQKLSLKKDYNRVLDRQLTAPWVTLSNADSLNVLYCFPNVAKNLYSKTDIELFQYADSCLQDSGYSLSNLPVLPMYGKFNYADSVEIINTENISGYIRGVDTTQTILLTAHYDHLGIRKGEIYYGADDNASGTAVMLETARLLVGGQKPQQNIQFIAFSAEELGLFGSREYVQNPWFPLDSTSFCLNMDMVERFDNKHKNKRSYVYMLTDGQNRKHWLQMAKKTARKQGALKLSSNPSEKERRAYQFGSDHYSFSEQSVSVGILFTGMHKDYHKPSDTPDKINYENMYSISNFVVNYLQEVAK